MEISDEGLAARLLLLETQFESAMRARGFDPSQAATVPLTARLDDLYRELEGLRQRVHTKKDRNIMTEIERIQDQLKRAFEGDAWHGPSVLQLLKDVSGSQAAAHPIRGAHSIWEIALHIAAWESAGRRRLQGDRAQLPDEEDWPTPADTSDEAWQKTCAMLVQNHKELQQEIARVNEARLDQPILEGLASVYMTLQGVVQHDLYHAGQIAILKRALA